MNNIHSSSDVWFCAFLLHKGFKILDYSVITRGKVTCRFDIADEEWQKLKLEFHNSEISAYKATIDKLKDLGYIFVFFIITKGLLCITVANQIV